MEKTIIISTEHPDNNPNCEQMKIKLIGGSPYYSYIFINGICYTIRETPRGLIKLEKTK